MTSITNFTAVEKTNLFLGAAFGFIIGSFFGPLHQDKESRIKKTIIEIGFAVIGFAVVYLFINYKYKLKSEMISGK